MKDAIALESMPPPLCKVVGQSTSVPVASRHRCSCASGGVKADAEGQRTGLGALISNFAAMSAYDEGLTRDGKAHGAHNDGLDIGGLCRG